MNAKPNSNLKAKRSTNNTNRTRLEIENALARPLLGYAVRSARVAVNCVEFAASKLVKCVLRDSVGLLLCRYALVEWWME
jgi:hypothetical protein